MPLASPEILLENLNLEIRRGERWLVAGETMPRSLPCSVLRPGSGMPAGGKITRPGLDEIFFLPERPYLPPGSLRDVLLRTGMESVTKDEEILAVLHQLGLVAAVDRAGGLDADKDWDDVFSDQRTAHAVHRPDLPGPAGLRVSRPAGKFAAEGPDRRHPRHAERAEHRGGRFRQKPGKRASATIRSWNSRRMANGWCTRSIGRSPGRSCFHGIKPDGK